MYVNSLPFSFNVCILFHEPWFIYHGSIYFYFGYHPICFLYSEPDRVVFPALSCRYGINLPLFCSYLAILICSFCRQQFVVQHSACLAAQTGRMDWLSPPEPVDGSVQPNQQG